MSGRAPGWYRDPDDHHLHRWWDGEVWQTQEDRLDDARRPSEDTTEDPGPVRDLD